MLSQEKSLKLVVAYVIIIIIIIIIIMIIITLLISSKRLFSLIYNVKYLKLSFPKIPLKMLFYFNFKYI